jgi:hypothetical protein
MREALLEESLPYSLGFGQRPLKITAIVSFLKRKPSSPACTSLQGHRKTSRQISAD